MYIDDYIDVWLLDHILKPDVEIAKLLKGVIF
jgi:hemerythrin